MVVRTVTWQCVRTARQSTKDMKTFTPCHCRSRATNRSMIPSASTRQVKWSRTINATRVRRKQTWPRVVTWLTLPTILLSTSPECVSTTISSKTKRSTADGNSHPNSICGTILLISWKTSQTPKTSSNMNSKVLCYTMELLISDTISLTSRKAKTSGSSSMMRESGSMIQEISKLIVSVAKTGEDNHKVLTFVSMKKLRRGPLSCNFKPKSKKKPLFHSSDSKRLSLKTKQSKRRKMKKQSKPKPNKNNQKPKSTINLNKHKNPRFSSI